MNERAALLIVDIQNDFCPGGALQIRQGDRVIEPTNKAIRHFLEGGLPILASRDWHPPITGHFKDFGGPWPVHCVQGTVGACFHPDLRLPPETVVLSKGLVPELPGYSVFEGVTTEGIQLETLLQELEIEKLYVCGLATDYCVLHTTRDALRRGFQVTLLTDAVAGVDASPGASTDALNEMTKAGALLATVDEIQMQPASSSSA